MTAASFAALPAAITPSASAAEPSFRVSPGTGNFGKVTYSNSPKKVFTVKNTSKVDLMFEITSVTPETQYSLALRTSGSEHCMVDAGSETHYWGVEPGGTCDFEIEFIPVDEDDYPPGKSVKGSLLVSAYSAAIGGDYVHGPSSGVLNTKTVKLSGKGVEPKVKVTPGTVNFGRVDSEGTAERTVTLTNKSDVPLAMLVDSQLFNAPFKFVYINSQDGDGECRTSDGYYWTVLPGESCTARVQVNEPGDSVETDFLSVELARGVGPYYQGPPSGDVIGYFEIQVKVTGQEN
ncbi:choice-of-anchor D domain-containing protein [Nocardioides humilatus]|uniref:choice-of-anchor D domain-containing protein n=1 Tax=Nocardioides humilatus TaxID=2607660 RepID=UPI00165FA65D|nr:choice-of-anchor D domain-containing protein [Nocardioides humilatus]